MSVNEIPQDILKTIFNYVELCNIEGLQIKKTADGLGNYDMLIRKNGYNLFSIVARGLGTESPPRYNFRNHGILTAKHLYDIYKICLAEQTAQVQTEQLPPDRLANFVGRFMQLLESED